MNVTSKSHERTDLLDAEQVGKQLRVNVKTVRRWISTGELRSIDLSNRRVTRVEWLEEFLDARASA